jgi:hypothetical protein
MSSGFNGWQAGLLGIAQEAHVDLPGLSLEGFTSTVFTT